MIPGHDRKEWETFVNGQVKRLNTVNQVNVGTTGVFF